MSLIKKLPPSLRERKRYIAFKVESDEAFKKEEVARAIRNEVLGFFGENTASELKLQVLEYDEKNQQGFLVCSHKEVGKIKACLSLISTINNNTVRVTPLGVSGTDRALRRKFLKGKLLIKDESMESKFLGSSVKIIRSFDNCLDALPEDKKLIERLKNLKIKYIGLTKKDMRSE